MAISNKGCPLMGTSALGMLSVMGRSRVPRPAAKIMARIWQVEKVEKTKKEPKKCKDSKNKVKLIIEE
jgi:hypothetical protein